jgi:general stress protein YciG
MPAAEPASSIQEQTMATNNQGASRGRSGRGFASMDPKRQREIASQGGKAAHEKGTAHEFNSEEARQAGSKGGQAAHQKGTAHEFNSEEAREAGRKGGQASHSGAATQQGGNQGEPG